MSTSQTASIIRHLRESKGLTQTELGERVFSVQQVISDWESGKSSPTTEMRIKLAEALDVPINVMFPEVIGHLRKDKRQFLTKMPYHQDKYLKMNAMESAVANIVTRQILSKTGPDFDEGLLADTIRAVTALTRDAIITQLRYQRIRKALDARTDAEEPTDESPTPDIDKILGTIDDLPDTCLDDLDDAELD